MKVAIIGGGITGLTLGYRLMKKGIKIMLFEKDSNLGGMAGSFKVSGADLEKYYHHFYVSEKEITNLIKEIHLGNDIIWKETKIGIFYKSKIFPFTTPKDLFVFSPLSFKERIRLAIAFSTFGHNDWKAFEDKTAMEWCLVQYGKKVTQIIWAPLLKSKFGKASNEIVATYLWERIKTRRQSRTKNLVKERIGYLQGGFSRLFDSLKKEIINGGGEILTNSFVQKIVTKGSECRGLLSNNKFYKTNKIIATTSTPQLLQMLPCLQDNYFSNLGHIKHQDTLCLILKLREKLSDMYWLNICDPHIPFAAIIEHTNFIPTSNYSGYHLVYLPMYISSDDSFYQFSAEKVFKRFIPYLKRLFPGFNRKLIIDYYVFRDKFTQPIFPLHYSNFKPTHCTSFRGLFLANITQVYPSSRSLNSCIKMANKCCNIITEG